MEDLEKLKDRILTYKLEGSKLGDLGYRRILIQICGSAGHGKSSFINSCKYALHGGTFSVSAPVAPAEVSQGAYTIVRLPYELTDGITMVDNRGFGKSDIFEKEEVYAQLANLQPLNEEVNWNRSFVDRMTVVTSSAHSMVDLLVPIFVYSVEHQVRENDKTEMIEFLKTTQNITGFLPIIVLTKKSRGDFKKIHQQFEAMDMENIFELENYTEEDHVKSPGKDKTFFTILAAVLDLVDYVAQNVEPNMDTAQEEYKKRVRMLLNMANENAIQREKEIWMKENVQSKKEKKCHVL